jgi:hypothetical protein
MKTTIERAREVDPVTRLLLDKKLPQGMDHDAFMWFLERFADLVRADEREQGQKWFDAVTAQHKQLILAEREACAKVCENLPMQQDVDVRDQAAAAIRARGETK